MLQIINIFFGLDNEAIILSEVLSPEIENDNQVSSDSHPISSVNSQQIKENSLNRNQFREEEISKKGAQGRIFLFQIKIIKFSEFIKNRPNPSIKTIYCYVPKNKGNQSFLEKWNNELIIQSFYHAKSGIIIKTKSIFQK